MVVVQEMTVVATGDRLVKMLRFWLIILARLSNSFGMMAEFVKLS